MPKNAKLLAVGGVGAGEWLQAGITGFGIGTELYVPGRAASEVFDRASQVVAAIQAAMEK